jgi:hypothetical protein
MDDAKHTPGPWITKKNPFTGTSSAVYSAAGSYIAVTDNSVGPTARIAEYEANARLIAAGPDLLFALEQLVGMAVIWEVVDGRKNIQLENSEAYQRARAVIATATAAHDDADEDSAPRCISTGQHRNDGRGMCIDCDYVMAADTNTELLEAAKYALGWLINLEKSWDRQPDRSKKCSTNEAAVAANALRNAIANATRGVQ